jgi:hypothetical protein
MQTMAVAIAMGFHWMAGTTRSGKISHPKPA